MATLNLTLTANGDDGYSNAGDFNAGAGSLYCGNFGSSYNVFFRFTGASSLQGATISAATLTFMGNSDGAGIGAFKSRIYAERAASPAAPTSHADYTARVRSTAFVQNNVKPVNGVDMSPGDLSAVIQEVVDNHTLTTLLLLMDDNGTDASTYVAIRSRETSTVTAARLDITYTAGAPPTPTSNPSPFTGRARRAALTHL